MLDVNMADVAWLDEEALASQIELQGKLRITMIIPELYVAQTPVETAGNWLKVWFIAESLATYANQVSCSFNEVDDGAGQVILEFESIDAPNMADRLSTFGGVFDPDDLEESAQIFDEALEWVENRGTARAIFPGLEECYRNEQAFAEEWEKEHPDE